ncbi:hypothetical protein [Flammeovirga sp. SJP92]|uniref:hypothetical protein n=1 Tax=Flammeovirga sp. SJP92 TaxID=1775430 RepID=UPI000788A09A|nr:hypothetical protein [Flammeovirga sp. SJP92]KXX67336.1 hypothetical protein AVL50_28575 [Flammeovirga sp. SJP92]
MYYSKLILIIAIVLGSNQLTAQNFSTGKELKKYYKENCNQFQNPKEGWNEAWIILPEEADFMIDLTEEVVEAKIYIENGEMKWIHYKGYGYHQEVYPLGTIKKGKGAFQKVILDISNELTEVYVAYDHTVIFKPQKTPTEPLLNTADEIGNVTFYSNENKLEKHGFYVFIQNTKSKDYDFVGFINKKCSDAEKCTSDNSLKVVLKNGKYEFYTVKDKIQINRKMPTRKYSIEVKGDASRPIELFTGTEN